MNTPRVVHAWLVVSLGPSMRYQVVGISLERAAVVEGPRLQVTVMGMTGRNYADAEKKVRAWVAKWYPWMEIP